MDTEEASKFDEEQKTLIKDLFSQGVRHKMKTKFVRSLSTSRPSGEIIGNGVKCTLELSSIVVTSRQQSLSSRVDVDSDNVDGDTFNQENITGRLTSGKYLIENRDINVNIFRVWKISSYYTGDREKNLFDRHS